MKIYQGIGCIIFSIVLFSTDAPWPAIGFLITGISFLISASSELEKNSKKIEDDTILGNRAEKIDEFVKSRFSLLTICTALESKYGIYPINSIHYIFKNYFNKFQDEIFSELIDKKEGDTHDYLESCSNSYINLETDTHKLISELDFSQNIVFFSPTMICEFSHPMIKTKKVQGYVILTTSTLLFVPAVLDLNYLKQNKLYNDIFNKVGRFSNPTVKIGLALNKFSGALHEKSQINEDLNQKLKSELLPNAKHEYCVAISLNSIDAIDQGNVLNLLFSKRTRIFLNDIQLEIRSQSYQNESLQFSEYLIWCCMLNDNSLIKVGSRYYSEYISYKNILQEHLVYNEFKSKVIQSLKTGEYVNPFEEE